MRSPFLKIQDDNRAELPAEAPADDLAQLVPAMHDMAIEMELRKSQALVHELEHRMKNMLAVVQSLAYQSFREGVPVTASRDAFIARLATLNRAYDLLAAERWAGTNLQAVIEAVLIPYHASHARVSLSGPQVHLSAQSATSFALAINELAANAEQYGALSVETGRIAVDWSLAGDRFDFSWLESGGPAVEPPARRGFGRKLIEFSLPSQFQGELRYDFLPQGVELALSAPVSAIQG